MQLMNSKFFARPINSIIMGANWLPDPPVGHRSPSPDEISSITAPPVFFVDSDNDDFLDIRPIVDENITENAGYQMLNNSDREESTDDDDDDEGFQSVETRTDSLENLSNNIINTEETQLVSSRDITVDYDQVRAAMASITLPPSSIPPWASSIPDSEWCTYLQNRIRILQEQDKKCD